MTDTAFWVALHQVPGIGPRSFGLLLEYFGSPQAVWQASAGKLKETPFLKREVVNRLLAYRQQTDPDQELAKLKAAGIKVVTLDDSLYPEPLRNIYDPPPILYLKGKETLLKGRAIAVVGSRRPTAYGRKVAYELSRQLAEAGITVVSGLARGIDTQAHRGSLEEHGSTIAVLGYGLDTVYPQENEKLFHEIGTNGLLLTEFPLGMIPLPQNFPARNRIISGLSMGVVVVEAGESSGALITADFALEQGRDVFAVPGPVTSPTSRGCHKLIKQGAKLVETGADILDEWQFLSQPTLFHNTGDPASIKLGLSSDEQKVLDYLSPAPIHFDRLLEDTGLSLSQLHTCLMYLQLKGLVIEHPGKFFSAC